LISKRIVITGAPGTGKTTIIETLKNQGYSCYDEISRAIIQEYQIEGIPNPFATHAEQFSERLFMGRVKQFKSAINCSKNVVFYDRAIHDVIAYLNYSKSKAPRNYVALAKESNYTKVFITPPWEAIYTTDSERFESFEEAVNIHEALMNTYKEFGYQPIAVPLESVALRTSFILKNI